MFSIPALTVLCFLPVASTCTLPIASSPFVSEIPIWRSRNFTCLGSPHAWEARPSPGKGMGVFATQTIEPGDIILTETPTIWITPPQFQDGVAYPLKDIEALVREKFEALSDEDKASIMVLTSHMTPADRWKDEVLAIFRNNAYIVGKDNTELGLFPRGARINHSCRPNTSHYWNDKKGKRIVYAMRRIEEGEEIYTTYIPLLHNHEARQKRLNQYGFNCTCEACSQDRAAREASDKRRLDIRKAVSDFEPQLTLSVPKSATMRKKAEKNAKASVQLAELVEEEGLPDYYAQVYRIAAISHARIEHWKPATIWAHKSYEWRLLANPNSIATLEMFNLTSRFISNWNDDLRDKSMNQK